MGLDGAAASFPSQHILANEKVYAAAHPSDKDDGTAQFNDDAKWIIEPSFVRRDWISFLSSSAKRKYITAIDEFSGYKLRSSANVFSPYFSSFRVYDTPERASQRVGNARMLRQVAAMKEAIGGAMIADDEL